MQKQPKKLIQINTVCNTSTGKIMGDIQREAIRQGYITLSLVGRRKPFLDMPCERIGNGVSFWIHVIVNTIFDRQGFSSVFVTRKLVERLRNEKPDIIHLHNLHGYYLNLPILFAYLKNEFKGQLFWTFHDCWPFTGHCAYFTMAECEKWKTGCYCCPNKKRYPVSLFLDSSGKNYQDKKKLFGEITNLTIIVPSNWMAKLVRQSFMNRYPLKIVPNGIDLEMFSYTVNENLYKKYKILQNKKILLGVANVWDERKGLNDFIGLSKKLSDKYIIVLIGLTKRQIRKLPSNIIGIRRTESRRELAAFYSMAEIFINPSLEESFSLVTVEAIACGTPVIALNTSAVKELVTSENGIVLNKHDAIEYMKAIEQLEEMNLDRRKVANSSCKFDNGRATAQMLDLYRE